MSEVRKGTRCALASAQMALCFAPVWKESPRIQSKCSPHLLSGLSFQELVDLRTCHWCFSSLFILPLHSSQAQNFPFSQHFGLREAVYKQFGSMLCGKKKKSMEGGIAANHSSAALHHTSSGFHLPDSPAKRIIML